MSKVLGNALSSARVAKGFTQQQVADHTGVSRAAVAQWERGSTEPSLQNLVTACEFLGLNVTAATAGMVRFKKIPSIKNDEVFNIVEDRRVDMRDEEEFWESVSGGKRLASEHPVPVKTVGLHAGFNEGDFIISDEIIDFVARPPGVSQKHVVHALYLPTASLAPRFEIGDIAFVSASRWTRAGDDIVLEMKGDQLDGGGRRSLLRRLVSQSASSLEVQTFSPPRTEVIERESIAAIFRLMPLPELLGL